MVLLDRDFTPKNNEIDQVFTYLFVFVVDRKESGVPTIESLAVEAETRRLVPQIRRNGFLLHKTGFLKICLFFRTRSGSWGNS